MTFEVIDYHDEDVRVLEIAAKRFEIESNREVTPPVLIKFFDDEDNGCGLVWLTSTTTIRPKLPDKPPTIVRRIKKGFKSPSHPELEDDDDDS